MLALYRYQWRDHALINHVWPAGYFLSHLFKSNYTKWPSGKMKAHLFPSYYRNIIYDWQFSYRVFIRFSAFLIKLVDMLSWYWSREWMPHQLEWQSLEIWLLKLFDIQQLQEKDRPIYLFFDEYAKSMYNMQMYKLLQSLRKWPWPWACKDFGPMVAEFYETVKNNLRLPWTRGPGDNNS